MLEWISSDATSVNELTYTVVVFPSVVSPTSVFVASNTSIQLFILHNQEYNISVVASNCAGNSTPAETTLRIGNCYMVTVGNDNVFSFANVNYQGIVLLQILDLTWLL